MSGDSKHPAIKLTYFDVKGRGEQVRLYLKDNAIPFEDNRISFPQLGEEQKKGTLPWGSVPFLEEGDFSIAQSPAILTYLETKYGQAGASWGTNQPRVISAICAAEDHRQLRLQSTLFAPADQKEALQKKHVEDKLLPRWLPNIEKMFAKSGGPYVLGAQVSAADASWFSELEMIVAVFHPDLQGFAGIRRFMEAYAARPNIAAYLRERKQTPV